MPPMRAFLLAALAFAGNVLAAPFAVQVGEARVALDAPPGFADTTFTGSPRLQELGESLTSASNRVLLFALSDADLRRFTLGDPLELRRYMIAVTSRASERERLSESAFKALAGGSVRELGTLPAPAQYQSYLESRPPGEVSTLAELRNDRDAVALLQGTRSKGRGMFERSKFMLSSTSLVLLRGKALSLSVYTHYDDTRDLEWIRATTARWIDELKRLNSR
jgi:hypothetical protein